MSQFRQNPISKHWVLIAPNRSKRPEQFASAPVMDKTIPEIDQGCVFCPGNEKANPEIASFPKGKDWQVRIIPNKFEALDHIQFHSAHKDLFETKTGSGDHEVIITRLHNEPVALQSVHTVELTLHVFRQRIKDISEQLHLAYVQIFHNHGKESGASLLHPHHQILSLPVVPQNIHDEITGCYYYYQHNGVNIYEHLIEEERRIGDRVVFETENFIVLAPFASRSPFETWIIPKFDSARFEDITDKQISDLSYVLKVALGQLYTKLSDPPLNFYIHTMPMKHVKNVAYDEKAYRWHLTIFPRLTTWGGAEYSTGIPINPMAPEEAAKFFKL